MAELFSTDADPSSEGEGQVNLETLLRCMEDWWDEATPPSNVGRGDLEALQGAWISTAGRRPAEFLVSGTHFAVRFLDGDIYMGAFDLDPSARPKTMALRIDEGPAQHRGKTALCVYELDGDALRWCTPGPGQTERLTAFPAPDASHYFRMDFRRELPR